MEMWGEALWGLEMSDGKGLLNSAYAEWWEQPKPERARRHRGFRMTQVLRSVATWLVSVLGRSAVNGAAAPRAKRYQS
jgi:hypothetical protein